MSPTDELSRETHKMILLLHKDFNELLAMIEETGKYARDIKDLEDQVLSLPSDGQDYKVSYSNIRS